MPKYYCDYCDTYLTHDSPSVRKTHCTGRKHKENVKFYYQKWMEEQAQNLIDTTTALFQAGKMPPSSIFQRPPPTGIAIPPPSSLQMGPPRPGMPMQQMGARPPFMGGPPIGMMGAMGSIPPQMMPGMRPGMPPMPPMSMMPQMGAGGRPPMMGGVPPGPRQPPLPMMHGTTVT